MVALYVTVSLLIFIYVFSMIAIGKIFGGKYLSKPTKKPEKMEKIQSNAFQLIGFVLVSITVLMVAPQISINLTDSISLFSLGFLLLIISVLMTEIKTANFIAFMSEKLNYGSLLCITSGFLSFFLNYNFLNLDVYFIYVSSFLFVLCFIIIDIFYSIKIFKAIGNVRKR